MLVVALLVWPAASALLLLATYLGAGPRLLGKRAAGTRHPAAWLAFGPYFLANAAAFHAYRLFTREPPFAAATPRLDFGRRLLGREVPPGRWAAVLDLAAEFPETPTLRSPGGYRSLPLLDATAPTEAELREAVAWLRGATARGPVYVHCALGHGRSACVVVAYLLASGEVRSAAEGVRRLRGVRPGVRLSRGQRGALRGFEKPGG